MDGNENPVAKTSTPNIADIDKQLAILTSRISNVSSHLRSSIHGESPISEGKDVAEMPTPSLSSIVRRIDDLRDYVSGLEAHCGHLHS